MKCDIAVKVPAVIIHKPVGILCIGHVEEPKRFDMFCDYRAALYCDQFRIDNFINRTLDGIGGLLDYKDCILAVYICGFDTQVIRKNKTAYQI